MLRSFFILLLLGVLLLTLALVVRSGWFEVHNNDEPINAAMRAAMTQERPELTTDDALTIDRLYPTAHTLKSGLKYVVRAPGTGKATPQIGDAVTVHYAGRLLDGTQIDSSYVGGIPLTFLVGTGQVIKGWDEALLSMKKGEKRTLIIPGRASCPRSRGRSTRAMIPGRCRDGSGAGAFWRCRRGGR